MLRRTAFVTLTSLALAVASFTANADILFSNLGTAAPPASVGGFTMTPFSESAQAALPDYTAVSIIPGSPVPGNLSVSPSATKATIPFGWNSSWSHGYTGPVFVTGSAGTGTLTLPPNTRAFYFYMEPDIYGTSSVTVMTNSGAQSGPVEVTVSLPGEADGATGFAFYSTAGETIASITINTASSTDFAIGEFAINSGISTTCASEGYKNTQLIWCKSICESTLTGKVLDSWIHRWIERYRQLPYCAVGGVTPPDNAPPQT